MKAIALRKESDFPELVDMPEPVLQDDQVLLKTIRCGVCGTDREIIKRKVPDAPPGSDFLVLGHEVLARVEEVGKDADTDLKKGDLSAVLVRRGCGKCNACLNDHSDYCYTGEYTERGIHKVHGFFCEYFTDDPKYLVKVPKELEDLGCLCEPMSISTKALLVADKLMGRVCFNGACSYTGVKEKALVAGHGPIGILGAMMLKIEGFDVYVMGRRQEGDPQREFITSFGAGYLDMTVDEDLKFAEENNGFLLELEATGISELTFQRLPRMLSRNGILVLTGVPRGPGEVCTDGNTLMASIVRFNQTITGTVNASKDCFEEAVRFLTEFKEKMPSNADGIITGRYNLDNWQKAFEKKSRNEVKAVIEF
ncbi:MAG: glucose 1-dehydrogenase [Planctomycetota bacterium]|jgi:threonine dehydrogenase-like Zn-dependent dehydrogenase